MATKKNKNNLSTNNLSQNNGERIRFGKSRHVIDYPNFLGVQVDSFNKFLSLDILPEDRKMEGLHKVFSENFPVSDTRSLFTLEFLDYNVDPPKYSISECLERDLTYSVSLKAKLKLYCNDTENEDFETIVQDVFIGNIPYMTPKGTFIINGAERVIVSQLHRSPGVFFGSIRHNNGSKLYTARVIPFKGAWIEFTTDINNVMYTYIDRKKKFPVTMLLRAIGYSSDKDILNLFGLADEVKVSEASIKKCIGRRLAARILRDWVEDFVDEDTGEVVSVNRNEIILERETIIQEEHVELIMNSGVKSILLMKEEKGEGEDYSVILNTLQKDTSNSEIEAVYHIYRQLRNSEPPDESTARNVIDKLFFSDTRYDLGEVGRYRINRKLSHNEDNEKRTLTKEDIKSIIRHMIKLINSRIEVDDIDHLSNRRVRTVGEQLYAQFSIGIARLARTIKEKMNIRDNEIFTPNDLINSRILGSVINSFFGTNQLSQFMDQTNPLAELTHKRRVSALGPGGLSRERAGFEVRDIHYTHYGRLCTIETPEGPNIGLISSLCVHAKINNFGFIQTPYRKIKDGKVEVNEPVVYLSAEDEDGKVIAQSSVEYDQKGIFRDKKIKARKESDYPDVEPSQVDFIDVSPNQITSIAASLIPFLEHNDANRALMGSNMQRQAVPVMKPEAPIVGTGLEARVAQDSRSLLTAEKKGVVMYVDSQKITIRYDMSREDKLLTFEDEIKTYDLSKFVRTNQNTVVNHRPVVKKGDMVEKGTILCEGYATNNGELALGRNLQVAFMPWQGYNFEDAIVISDSVVSQDMFTSIHIEEFEVDVKDTRRGQEEFTPDIPNIAKEMTANLGEDGIIKIGTEVKEGDVLVGKIAPRGEADPTPEEKLLRAIFGDKASDIRDASLKVPPSVQGVVIDTKLFKKSKKTKAKGKLKLVQLKEEHDKKCKALKTVLIDKLLKILGKFQSDEICDIYGEVQIKKGTKFTKTVLNKLNYEMIVITKWTKHEEVNEKVTTVINNYKSEYRKILKEYRRAEYDISVGDELPSGTLQKAKVYLASKRKLKIGDKMAGRHGNKGVVAKIVRKEDMPFMEDGTPVDIVLNPLGVPSRMNLGQIYETVLGWVGKELGVKFATPIFDGATAEEVDEWVEKAGLPKWGRVNLYDGQTGDRFDQATTVGTVYMLKLAHMVDYKMHTRSIGPYSLITQQPLGGKAQMGGQRFGEMEVWALEAYGAANVLQEILTIKSDDVIGRAKTYEAIVKGENIPKPSVPESFNVLVHELRGLGLEINLE